MLGSDMLGLGKILGVSQADEIHKKDFSVWISPKQVHLSWKLHLPMVIQIYNPRESMIRRHAM